MKFLTIILHKSMEILEQTIREAVKTSEPFILGKISSFTINSRDSWSRYHAFYFIIICI